MKKWIKRHERAIKITICCFFLCLMTSLGVQAYISESLLSFAVQSAGAILWLSLLLATTGAFDKLFRWWDKD